MKDPLIVKLLMVLNYLRAEDITLPLDTIATTTKTCLTLVHAWVTLNGCVCVCVCVYYSQASCANRLSSYVPHHCPLLFNTQIEKLGILFFFLLFLIVILPLLFFLIVDFPLLLI